MGESEGTHPRDSAGLVGRSLAAPGDIRALPAPDERPVAEVGLVVLRGDGPARLAARAIAGLAGRWAPWPLLVAGEDEPVGRLPASVVDLAVDGLIDPDAPVQMGAKVGANVGLATRVVAGLGRLNRLAGGTAVDQLSPAEVADRLEARLAHHGAEGTVAHVVRSIGRTLPIFHGGGPVGGALADQARYQANRHGKVVSWAAATPDLRHGEVCSWGQHGDVTRQVFTAVFLRGGHESAADGEALDRYVELLDEFVASVLVIEAGDGDPLVDTCVLAVLAEQIGLGLALTEGYDPAPAPGLEWRV